MNIALNRKTTRGRKAVASLRRLRDHARELRTAHAEHSALRRELATYRTQSEIDDLLASVSQDDSPDAERIRTALIHNQQDRASHPRTAWIAA